MNEEIANNFIQLLMRSSFGQAGACKDNPQCRIENVRVDCGETTRRRKDTTSGKQKETVSLTVSFSIKIPLNVHSNASLDLNKTSQHISNDFLAALAKVDMNLNVTGFIIHIDPSKPPEVRLTRLVCDEGQVQSGAICGKLNIILPAIYWTKTYSDMTPANTAQSVAIQLKATVQYALLIMLFVHCGHSF